VSFFCLALLDERELLDERDRLEELFPLLDDLDRLDRPLVDLDLDLGLELWAAMSPPGR
jgi:hypothetical protein